MTGPGRRALPSPAPRPAGARAVAAYLAKADWYFTTSPARPFVGLGLGLYRIGSGSQNVSGR